MKSVKDKFSAQADPYAKFRPRYPEDLYAFLLGLPTEFTSAWDCGTGNGQVAGKLAEKFERVYATDISKQQLDNAVRKPNIRYDVARAEQTSLPPASIDLITSAQAIHWFDFDAFYAEVRRVAKPRAIIAAWAYNRISISSAIDPIIDDLYHNTLGSYWDPERKFVDENYESIPFPFNEIEAPRLQITASWRFEQVIGYLNSWSSVQNYIKQHLRNPVDAVEKK
ncbi:MAG TPA: class I SAM-dependent methyltransferase, partial [Bacteroidota bacterium]|nr:class I SAM-dependent methyltransferase [Bacteroidota bacterium]